MHPDTAAREGVQDGEWVYVAASGRRVAMRARVTDRILPGVLCASATWWYPEEPGPASWRRSNVNLLTGNDDESPEMGSSNFRGVRCSLEKLGE
jgi:anaerobic selenocysteine-containing dehydrogenase